EGLAAPLKGMGIAFSSSLFGLGGSLILGFLDLQAGHAQGRFYNELEDWLSSITELQSAEGTAVTGVPPQLRFALLDMQRSLSDLSEKIELRVLGDNTGDAVKDLAQGVEKLIRQMRAEQKVVREWADEQAQQQHELATVLKQITSKAKLPAREERG
ncbi:MAG: flagellar motor protein MotA, partial [Methyloceanibacter sp.]